MAILNANTATTDGSNTKATIGDYDFYPYYAEEYILLAAIGANGSSNPPVKTFSTTGTPTLGHSGMYMRRTDGADFRVASISAAASDWLAAGHATQVQIIGRSGLGVSAGSQLFSQILTLDSSAPYDFTAYAMTNAAVDIKSLVVWSSGTKPEATYQIGNIDVSQVIADITPPTCIITMPVSILI